MIKLNEQEMKSYLNQIGITDIEAPTKAYLFELHKAHMRTKSWQTIDIFGGKPAAIDFEQSIALMLQGRSGYCFHLNGAFSTLLHSLGFDVSLHRGGVQPIGTEPRINSFHLGVSVRIEEETWIIDVGLGDMLYEPLPLLFATYERTPDTYKVEPSSLAKNGWRLVHDPEAFFVGADYDPTALQDIECFKENHHFYSTSKESPWHDVFLIRSRHEWEGQELRGCVWKRRTKNGISSTEINQKALWFEVMAEQFGEKLVHYSKLEREQMWKRVREQHEAWKLIKS
ncbi:arylamine N-acetyltransferase family protein [Paenibacillus sinopodophylli]|uniref:arylamine N-acetyltransferase family protein n=1 Tax=Paenibacillus sinopodophylli TaxID=1837342 RepID=UPI0014870E0F|nr:arylamine N-acetyltransferase [Paenibacillus sinopodophylli]